MVEKKCKTCGHNLKVHNYRANAKYCSYKCYWKYRWGVEGRKESKKVTVKLIIAICKQCGEEFEYNYTTGGRPERCVGCIIIRKKEFAKEYRQTAKSKAINKRYRSTERGKMLALITVKKYYNTTEGRKKINKRKQSKKYKEATYRHNKKKRKNLHHDYIKTLLAASLEIERKDITLGMIELKRMQIKFNRERKRGEEVLNELY